jgi:hypothetical protein
VPQVVAQVWVPVPPEVAFAVSQTTGEARLAWDPFIRAQHLIGADRPGRGVRTFTRARVGPLRGFAMVSRYVSYAPPTSVGMTMERGPWFFAGFGGGWRFVPERRDGVEGTTATWKYTYSIRPRLLRFVAEPVGQRVLGREIRARIEAFRRACADPATRAAAL